MRIIEAKEGGEEVSNGLKEAKEGLKAKDFNPLGNIEEWQDYKESLYTEDPTWNPTNPEKKRDEFRNYQANPRQERVRNFYRVNHEKQTLQFVLNQEKKYMKLGRFKMGVWEALELLDKYVDDSDPDTNLSQLAHALQTAEAVRAKYPDEKYDWYHLTGLIHDMGKFLGSVYKEDQWCVVGDTFPLGCKFAKKIEFSKFFNNNVDSNNPLLNTRCGIYKRGCGLENVHMSWGHDEYLYQVCVQNQCTLPQEALYMIRYHSFYPWHKEGEYMHLCNSTDLAMLKWVQDFNNFDLYSKSDKVANKEELTKYYKKLINKYFPKELNW